MGKLISLVLSNLLFMYADKHMNKHTDLNCHYNVGAKSLPFTDFTVSGLYFQFEVVGLWWGESPSARQNSILKIKPSGCVDS